MVRETAGCRSDSAFFEPLEARLLLSVMLDNGLATNALDYFAIYVDGGGGSRQSRYAGTDTIYDYFPYLEIGGEVFNLYNRGSAPVLQGDKVVSDASLSVPGGTIDVHVESRIPNGTGWLINTYRFTASGGVSLRDARFFQYLDSDIYSVSDDVLKVSGTVAGGDLTLTTIDPGTHVRLEQILGQPQLGAAATGFAAERYSNLRDDITGGTFDPPPEGYIDTNALPLHTRVGVGECYGPGDVTTAIEYSFTSATSAILRTTLGVSDLAVGVPDLLVTHVAEPVAVQRGQSLPVSWIVQNRSDTAATAASWTDRVFLSADQTLSADDRSVGTLVHTGGLAARAVYNATLNVDPSAVPDGIYYLLVAADSADVVEEGRLDGNNWTASESALWLGVPELMPGTPLPGTFQSGGQARYYVVSMAEGQHLQITLDDANDIGHNELYVRYGQPPTRSEYDARYTTNMAADQQVLVPDTLPGLYYVMAYGESVPDAPGSFAVTASFPAFSVLGVSPNYGGNSGLSTITVKGIGLDPSATVRLVSDGGTRLKPAFLYFPAPDRLEAVFDLTGVARGTYDVSISEAAGSPVVLSDAFEVQAARPPSLALQVVSPAAVRSGVTTRLYMKVTNDGNVSVRSARISAHVTGGALSSPVPLAWQFLSGQAPGTEDRVSVFVWDLAPGESRTVPIDATLVTTGSFTVDGAVDLIHAGGSVPAREGMLHPDPYFDEHGSAPPPPDPGSLIWTGGTDSLTGHEGVIYYGTNGVYVAENLPQGGTQLTPWGDFAARYPKGWYDWYTPADITGTDVRAWSNGQPPAGSDVANLQTWILANVDPDGPRGPATGGHPYQPWYKCTDFASEAFSEGMGMDLIIDHNMFNSPAFDYWVLTNKSFPGFWPNVFQIPKVLFDPFGVGLDVLQRLFSGTAVRSFDPNEMVGPAGLVPELDYVACGAELPYTVYFENDPNLATAPAQAVRVTNPLDSGLDPATFELREIVFGSHTIAVPPGLNYYATTLDLRPEGTNLLVKIEAGLNSNTGMATWTLTSLDPLTLAPPDDPFVGFLPVNDATHRGEGHVSYAIRPNADLPSRTVVRGAASIVFDVNDPIQTNTAVNRVITPYMQTLTPGIRTSKWTFSDLTRDLVTVTLGGKAGSAQVLRDVAPGEPGDALAFVLDGTDAKSSFTIATRIGAETCVGDIIVRGSVAGLTGKTTDLLGNLNVMGTLQTLQLADATGGGLIHLGGLPTSKTAAALTLNRVADLAIDSTMPIRSITATEWLDTDGTADLIRAPSLGSLVIKGQRGIPRRGVADLAGDFEANLGISGESKDATGKTLGSVSIKGSVGANTWDITGKVGPVAISGTVGEADRPWQLGNAVSIASLTLGDVTNATVAAGGSIGAIKAMRWLDGSISAASIASIATSGKAGLGRAAPILGDFGADVTLTGAARLALGTLAIAGWLDGATIVSTHSPLGTLTLGGIRSSTIMAGDMGASKTSINRLTVTGIKGQKYVFVNSNVAAYTLGRMSVKGVDPVGTPGETFGITGHTMTSYSRDGKPKPKLLSGAVDQWGAYLVRLS